MLVLKAVFASVSLVFGLVSSSFARGGKESSSAVVAGGDGVTLASPAGG